MQSIKSISPVGSFLETDNDGFLICQASPSKIIEPWQALAHELKQYYLNALDATIYGIYLRGSVATGQAIEGLSDIDSFAILLKSVQDVDYDWTHKAREKLLKKYAFTTGIGIQLIGYNDVFGEQANRSDRFTIKTQSACIYGKDVAALIEPFKANKATALFLCCHFGRTLGRLKENIFSSKDDSNIVKYWCRWFMKQCLRSGFSLVMCYEKRYTRDLSLCAQSLCHYFPQNKQIILQALQLAINPIDKVELIVDLADDLSSWLEKTAMETFYPY